MNRLNQIENGIRSMEGGEFQKLCDRYLHQKYGWELFTPGSMDGTNKTTAGTPDTYAYMYGSGKYILAMYGTRENSVKKLEADIKDAKEKSKLSEEKIETIVCCYAGSNIPVSEHDRLVGLASPYALVICNSTSIAMDLMDEYQTLAFEYFDLPKKGQVNNLRDFIKKHDGSKINAPLSTKYIDQNNRLAQIKQTIGDKQITVVTGKPGTGKTRIAIEALHEIDSSPKNNCLFIKNNQQPLYFELEGFLSKKRENYVLIDDANEINDLKSVMSLLQEYTNIHYVLTVREYALENIKEITAPYDTKDFVIMNLQESKIDDLLQEFFPNDVILRSKIIERSHLNARQAVIAAKMVKEKGKFILDDSKEVMLQYYGTVVKDAELSDSCLRTLFIIAVFDRTKFRNEGKLNNLMSILGLDHQQFIKDIAWMKSKEICDVFQDEAVRIEDQSLRDYILYFFLFESKRYSLQVLFNSLYDSGIGYLIRSVNRANSVENNQLNYRLLKGVVRKFYGEHFGQSSDNDRIEFLKSFGSLLGSEVIQVGLNMIEKTLVKKHEIDFDLNKFDRRVRGKTNDFTILMKNLIIENRKDNSQMVFDLCMQLLQKDNTIIKEIGDFLITEFEINPSLPDIFEPLKESIPALKDQARKSISIIDECMFFVIRGLLATSGSKTYSRDSNTISSVNYRLNDDSIDMSVREDLFKVLEMVISNGHVPGEALLIIAKENVTFTEKSREIGMMAGNYFLQMMKLPKSNVNKNNVDLLQVMAKHVEYLAGNVSLEQVMASLNTLQTCCWVLSNYSDKSQHWNSNVNIQLDSWVKHLNDDMGSIEAVALCLQSNKLLNSYVIEGQLQSGLKAVGEKQKDKILGCLFNTGLKHVDDYMIYRLVQQYGVGKFLERYENQYKDNIRLMYLIYSGILIPLGTDVPKLYAVMERLSNQEWAIVNYEAMSEAYQTNTEMVNLVIQKSLELGLYNGFKYITEKTALNIINNVSRKEQLFKWYAEGIARGVDYDNTLFKLLINDVIFQKIVINSLFNSPANVYWKSQISVSPKMDLLWEKSSFRDELNRKLDSPSIIYRSLNSGWEAVFLEIYDLNKKWLLNSLENTTSLTVAQKIMLLVNRFFTYDDSIDFFRVISESIFSLDNFEICKMSKSWVGSEVPVIKKDLAFILKIRPIFKDAASIMYLKKLQEKLEDEMQRILLNEYLQEI